MCVEGLFGLTAGPQVAPLPGPQHAGPNGVRPADLLGGVPHEGRGAQLVAGQVGGISGTLKQVGVGHPELPSAPGDRSQRPKAVR